MQNKTDKGTSLVSKSLAVRNLNSVIDSFSASKTNRYVLPCKKYKTLPENIGSFITITGDTFVIRKGSWLDTYDRFGKKISTRPAR